MPENDARFDYVCGYIAFLTGQHELLLLAHFCCIDMRRNSSYKSGPVAAGLAFHLEKQQELLKMQVSTGS